MLENAGVEFEVVHPDVDEREAKSEKSDAAKIAKGLAEAKALSVSATRPGDWVIGGDSVVSVGDRLFDKPVSREEAAEHLRFFAGKKMVLTSGVALARGEAVDWSHVGMAELVVRDLTEEFIESYLDGEWPEVGDTVGVFRLEGRGVQLFDVIAGGHFVILGMPLVPLLKALRERGMLQS